MFRARYAVCALFASVLLVWAGCGKDNPLTSSPGPLPALTPASTSIATFSACLDGSIQRKEGLADCVSCLPADFDVDVDSKTALVFDDYPALGCGTSCMVLYFDTSSLPDLSFITSVHLKMNVTDLDVVGTFSPRIVVAVNNVDTCPQDLVPDQTFPGCGQPFPPLGYLNPVGGTGPVDFTISDGEAWISKTGVTGIRITVSPNFSKSGDSMSAAFSTQDSDSPEDRPQLEITYDENTFVPCFDASATHSQGTTGCDASNFSFNDTGVRGDVTRYWPPQGLSNEAQSMMVFPTDAIPPEKEVATATLVFTVPYTRSLGATVKRLRIYSVKGPSDVGCPTEMTPDDFKGCADLTDAIDLGTVTITGPTTYNFSIPDPANSIYRDESTKFLFVDDSSFSEDGMHHLQIYMSEVVSYKPRLVLTF